MEVISHYFVTVMPIAYMVSCHHSTYKQAAEPTEAIENCLTQKMVENDDEDEDENVIHLMEVP